MTTPSLSAVMRDAVRAARPRSSAPTTWQEAVERMRALPPDPNKRPSPYGKAVLDGVARYGSASSLTTVDAGSYAGCERRWFFDKVIGLKEETTKAQDVGIRCHNVIDSYLVTGVRAFPPIVMAGAHYIPRPGPDLENECEIATPFGAPRVLRDVAVDPTLSPVRAGNLPLVGRLDLSHGRGVRIDRAGDLVEDSAVQREIIDWKTTGSLAYAKSALELRDNVQMDVYDRRERLRDPTIVRVRRTHVYMTTKTPYAADLISTVVDGEHAARRWEYVESLARLVQDLARETDPDRVPGNRKSCDAYRGCPHRKYCSANKFNSLASAGFSAAAISTQTKPKEIAVADATLFQTITAGVTAAPPRPEVQLDIAAAMAALDAQEKTAVAAKSLLTPELRAAFAYIDEIKFGCPMLTGEAARARYEYIGHEPSSSESAITGLGKLAGVPAITTTDKIIDLARALRVRVGAQPAPPAPEIVAPPAPIVVAPPPAAATAAVPVLSPETPASRPDLAALPAPGLAAPPPSPIAQVAAVPPPGASPALPPPAPTPPAGPTSADIAAAGPPADVGKTGKKKKSGKVAETSVLYIDCAPSVEFESLGRLRHMINAQAATLYSCDPPDVRCSPAKGSPAAFSGWRGCIEQIARATAPKLPRGHYVIRTRGDEIAQSVAMGLEAAEVDGAPVFDIVVRGAM